MLLHQGWGKAVRFCSLKKSILVFERFLSSQARAVYFCELGQRGSSNLDRVFLCWTVYEAAIWVSPSSVENNHRLLLSLLLLFKLSFIPSNDRRPSSCLSSSFVLLASSAKTEAGGRQVESQVYLTLENQRKAILIPQIHWYYCKCWSLALLIGSCILGNSSSFPELHFSPSFGCVKELSKVIWLCFL